jgi:hypothetical protein
MTKRILVLTLLALVVAVYAKIFTNAPAKREEEPGLTITTTILDKKTGAKKVATSKHFGPIPDCTEPVTYTPCRVIMKPRKLTPAEREGSINRRKPIAER